MYGSLEKIRIWLECNVPHFASSLQPGLSVKAMQRIMEPKSARYRIPGEVVELYMWRNGQAEAVPFFDNLRFQPFEHAVAYGNLVQEHLGGALPLMVFQDLDYDAGYQFRCGFTDQESAPAYRWDHGDERIETPSLTDLLRAVAEAFESGAFRSNDLGGLNTDDKVWNAILLRYHPDRMRGVNALLHRQWSELNGEQLRGAFQDLVRINHSETAALVREYLSRELDQLVHDFETFYTSVSAGISIQDEWTRDFMLRLAFSDDSQIRQTALTSLAWSWRGELRLTAQHVDRLINMTRQPSDHNNRERAMLLGMSGDHRAVPALLRIIDDQSGGRDARIAALRALGRLRAVEARQVCLTVAQTDSDPGTRISAVSALIDLGFEDEPVERAAKAYFREMLRQSGSVATQSESPTLKRWLEEAKRSTPNDGVL